MEISKLRKMLNSFERNHGKLYESVDVHVYGENITFNAIAAGIVDGIKLNMVTIETDKLVDGTYDKETVPIDCGVFSS